MRALPILLVLLAAIAPTAADARTDRLDHRFNDGIGWKRFGIGGSDSGAQAVLRTRAGKLLVGGYTRRGLGVGRLHPSGRWDRRFGRDGRVQLTGPGDLSGVAGMVEARRGRVLVGVGLENYNSEVGEVAVLRLLPNGRPDRAYGTDGVARVAIPGPNPAAVGLVAVLRRPNDGLLLVVNTTDAADERTAFVRLNARGQIVAGPTLVDLDGHAATSAVRLPGGDVAVAATDYDRPRHGLLAVLREDGVRTRKRDLPGLSIFSLRRDGAEVVGVVARNFRWGVRRFTRRLAQRRAPALFSGRAGALAVDRRHRAWVALDNGRIARVRRDGRLDSRFGRGGRSTPFASRWILDASDLITHPRGGAFAVGRASQDFDIREDYGPSRMWIARYR